MIYLPGERRGLASVCTVLNAVRFYHIHWMRTTYLTHSEWQLLFFPNNPKGAPTFVIFRAFETSKTFVPSYWISSWVMWKWSSSSKMLAHTHTRKLEFWLNYLMLNFISPRMFKHSHARISLFWSMPSFGLMDGHSESVCTVHILCATALHWNSSIYEITSNIPSICSMYMEHHGKVSRRWERKNNTQQRITFRKWFMNDDKRNFSLGDFVVVRCTI